MKTEELMIGDWVLVKELDPYNLTNVISEYQHQLRLKDFAEMYNAGEYKKYEPIPLTKEILEKNGFTSVEDRYNHKKYFLLGKNEYNCDVYWEGLTILLVEEDYEPTTYAYICDAEYVHELQHVLKLCNIKKEIVL